MRYIGILISRILEKNTTGVLIPKVIKRVSSRDKHGEPWKSHMDIVRFVTESADNNDTLIAIMFPPILDVKKDGGYPMCEQKLKEKYFDILDEAHKELAIRDLISIVTPDKPTPNVRSSKGYYTMFIPEVYRMRFTRPSHEYQINDTVIGMMTGAVSCDELRILSVKDSLLDLVVQGFTDTE